MKRVLAVAFVFLLAISSEPMANAYVVDSVVPLAGGCPQPERWNLSLASPLARRWSTSFPSTSPTVLTAAPQGSASQLDEIEHAISDSFGAWSGVTGTTFNAASRPGLLAPIGRVSEAEACTNDQESNIDGLNTICFNQPSDSFTPGVLAFTRIIVANSAGASIGTGEPAAFAGQILDADTLFRDDGQTTFATPAALATPRGQGSYDLESLLIHEIGHWFGMDHSAIWRSVMFPYAPPPGQYLGDRPAAQAPDGPLADDDRTGIRSLYPDVDDSADIGSIQGRVLPANPFALAQLPAPSPGSYVTGIFGAQVVAVDAHTGAVVAGTLGGWSCEESDSVVRFDGSFKIERLPVDHRYLIYAEPLVGITGPADFSGALNGLCSASANSSCTVPAVDTNFNPRFRPGSP